MMGQSDAIASRTCSTPDDNPSVPGDAARWVLAGFDPA
jgi:hypothetical protein